MQQSISTSIQQNSKFDFFHKKKIIESPQSLSNFLIILVSTLTIIAFVFLGVNCFYASKYIEMDKVLAKDILIKHNQVDEFMNSLLVSLQEKSLGDVQLSLNLLQQSQSIILNTQVINLLLNNPIYEKNSKKYSSEYKIIILSYLLSIKNNMTLEASELYADQYFQERVFLSSQKEALNKKISKDYLNYKQNIDFFKDSYLKLINPIDDTHFKSILKKHYEDLSYSFDKNLKELPLNKSQILYFKK